jgi:hypothetical protein
MRVIGGMVRPPKQITGRACIRPVYRFAISEWLAFGQNGGVITHIRICGVTIGKLGPGAEDAALAAAPTAARRPQRRLSLPQPVPSISKPLRKRGRDLLHSLGNDGNYDRLLAYSASRLARIGLHSDLAADLVHDAVQGVLLGLEGQDGRHPRGEDLQDMRSFLAYLQQVIQSLATNIGRHQRCLRFTSLAALGDAAWSLEKPLEVELMGPAHPEHNAEFRDLRRELFSRLRQRAPARLRRMINAWHKDFFWEDTIQLRGAHRQHRAELRALARQILREIEPTLSASYRQDKEAPPQTSSPSPKSSSADL